MKRAVGIRLALASIALVTVASAQRNRDPLDAIQHKRVTPAVAEGATIAVFDEEERPCVGASVTLFPNKLLFRPDVLQMRRRLAQQQWVREDVEVNLIFAANFGTRYQTGADGTVCVPNDQRYVVIASDDGAVAGAHVRKDREELELVLRPRQGVRVRVVDARGKPAPHVPVVAVTSDSFLLDFPSPIAWTNDGGMTFAFPGVANPFEAEDLLIGVRFAGVAPISKRISAADVKAKKQVDLQVPEYGQVKVLAFDDDGEPLDTVESAEIRLASADRWSDGVLAPVVTPDGAFFPCVALGQNYRVTLSLKGDVELEIEGSGPKRRRELTIFTNKKAEALRVVTFVAQRKGKPIKNSKLGVGLVSETRGEVEEFRSDADGKVTVKIPEDFESPIRLYVMQRGFFDVSLGSAVTELSPDLAPGVPTDLGVLSLEPDPVLVAGRVVDLEGQPIEGVRVDADVFRVEFGRFARGYSSCRTTTDAEGRFELRHASRDVGDVTASRDGWFVKSAPVVAVGDDDAEFVLGRGGTVRATLAGEPDLRLSCRLWEGAEKSYRDFDDGVVEFSELEPGEYVFTIEACDSEVLRIEGLKVEAGQVLQDPRLEDIDCEALVRVVEFEVVDEAGVDVESGWIHLQEQDSRRSDWVWFSSRRRPKLVLPKKKAKFDVRVQAEGLATKWVEDIQPGQKLVMAPAIRIPLRLSGEVELPKDVSLLVKLEREKRQGRLFFFHEDSVPFAGGKAVVEVDELGEHKVKLSVQLRESSNRSVEMEVPFRFEAVDLKADTATVGVELKIDDEVRECIEDAIESARESARVR